MSPKWTFRRFAEASGLAFVDDDGEALDLDELCDAWLEEVGEHGRKPRSHASPDPGLVARVHDVGEVEANLLDAESEDRVAIAGHVGERAYVAFSDIIATLSCDGETHAFAAFKEKERGEPFETAILDDLSDDPWIHPADLKGVPGKRLPAAATRQVAELLALLGEWDPDDLGPHHGHARGSLDGSPGTYVFDDRGAWLGERGATTRAVADAIASRLLGEGWRYRPHTDGNRRSEAPREPEKVFAKDAGRGRGEPSQSRTLRLVAKGRLVEALRADGRFGDILARIDHTATREAAPVPVEDEP